MIQDKWHYCLWLEDLCVGVDFKDWRIPGINWMDGQLGINLGCFYAFVARSVDDDE